MATDTLTLNPPITPQRVFYSTGRMLGVDDFQADQDYHRGRLARALVQLHGTGTVSGLLVQTDGSSDVTKLELQVTPGIAIDRVGRIIDAPQTLCIVLNTWLTQQITAWQSQLANPVSEQTAIPDPNTAIHDGHNLMCDVFATFVGCTRGLTPCFASEDDYDATDAFSANRLLDSFAMQLVLRTDLNPLTPVDPWKASGTITAPGADLTAPAAPTTTTVSPTTTTSPTTTPVVTTTVVPTTTPAPTTTAVPTATPTTTTQLQNLLLAGTAGPAAAAIEYPPNMDTSSVFLARVLIAAKAGTAGQPPTWDLTQISIDNNSRLFVYPHALLARLIGLPSGTEA